MVRALASFVSGSIERTNPFEGGPAFEAWQNGTTVMANTWGGYASNLAELLGPDATRDELLGKLCISPEDLQDPRVHFKSISEFDHYRDRFHQTTRQEATDYYAPEIKRMELTLATIMEGHKVPDETAAHDEADALQDEISKANGAFDEIADPTAEDRQRHDFDQTERCMRRDALHSGTIMPLADFVDTMLQVNLMHPGDFYSELAPTWVRALSAAVAVFYEDWKYDSDMPVDRIVVGRDVFDTMRAYLSDIWAEQHAHSEERWAEVEPVFITDYIAQHPLITGQGEK